MRGFLEKEEQMWALWFTSVPGIGRKTLYRLEEKFGSLKRAAAASEEELSRVVSPSQIRSLREFSRTPDQLIKQCNQAGVRYVTASCGQDMTAMLPERLKQIPDPPYGLFVKGELPDPGRPTVAMIGARACSGYGREAARLMGEAAAAAGIQVVSGMARGIDSVSQKACLDAGGKSFGILGSGVDVCYPAQARPLYEQLAHVGGLISEYPLGMQPLQGNFPPRNRLISGLSDLVLVIEARERSGTLITVDMALEQGREVAVLPGRITDALSGGCHRLYEQGAQLVTSPQRMAELVWESFEARHKGTRAAEPGKSVSERNDTPKSVGLRQRPDENGDVQWNEAGQGNLLAGCLSPLQSRVFRLLDLTPQPTEQLYDLFLENGGGENLSSFLSILLELELMGLCEKVGGMYMKKEGEGLSTSFFL